MFWALLAAAIFAWFAGVLGVFALRAWRQQVPFRNRFGLRGERVRRDVVAWDAGHRAAAPFIGTAALICLIQAGACAWTGLSAPSGAAAYVAILIGTGMLLVALLMVLAQKAASRF